MKKAVMGLVGIAIGAMGVFSGCYQVSYVPDAYNKEVAKMNEFYKDQKEINKMIEGDPNESYHFSRIQKKGNNLLVFFESKKENRVVFYQGDKNGDYSKKNIIIVSKPLDVMVLPKLQEPKPPVYDPNSLLEEIKKEIERLKKKEMI